MTHRQSLVRTLLAAALVAGSAAPAAAQAYNYPQFQPPRVTTVREFNGGIASGGDAGTSLLGQWREPVSPRAQLGFDLGFADADGASAFFFGGQYGHQLATANVNMPLDLLLTIGGNFASLNPEADGADNTSLIRIPFGVALGHRFPIEGGMSITPYVHPRLAWQRISANDASDSEIALDFDLGADFKFSPAFGMRVSARLGGGDYLDEEAFGVSLAWTPARRR